MEDILISHKQYRALLERLDEVRKDLNAIRLKKSPELTLIDTYDLAKLLNMSERTIQRWRQAGRLPYHRIGDKVYYNASVILEFFKVNPISTIGDESPPVDIPELKDEEVEMTCQRCPLFLLLTL